MMRQDRILVVSDLDGTLLDNQQKISSKNLSTINSFRQAGGHFTIATGRMRKATEPIYQQLNIELPVIVYNGGQIYDPIHHKTLFEVELKAYQPVLKELILLSNKKPLGILLYSQEDVFTPNKNAIIKEYEQKDKVKTHQLNLDKLDKKVTKILTISPDLKVLKECEKITEQHNQGYWNLVYSEHNYYEILPKEASKGRAIKYLFTLLPDDQQFDYLYCIGDNMNDLSMLKLADTGFYVKNSHKSLYQEQFTPTVANIDHAVSLVLRDIMVKHKLSI